MTGESDAESLKHGPMVRSQGVARRERILKAISGDETPASPKRLGPEGSPDHNASGFLATRPSASRYDHTSADPREAAALIAEFIPEGCRVLEVGCGTGSVATVVRRLRKARVIGVEPDAERACLARDRGFEVICGYLTEELVKGLGAFDVVLFADVLEHLPNPSALLQLACSALGRGGVVVLSVPNVAHWSIRWNLLRGRFNYEESGIMDATHLRWFTTDSLASWLQKNGLRVECMAHSAGTWLSVYHAWPWRLAFRGHRSAAIGHLAKRWPKLFGCQCVVRASRIAASNDGNLTQADCPLPAAVTSHPGK